jgi:hypothetical protein
VISGCPTAVPAYPSFDLAPLLDHPRVNVRYVDPVDGAIPAAALEDVDALILLVPRFGAMSVPKSGRLAVVARFGVGYDTVDVPACTANDIALVDHARRRAPAGGRGHPHLHAGARRQAHQGPARPPRPRGLGRALAAHGHGPRRPHARPARHRQYRRRGLPHRKPLDMRFIAFDPYADPTVARELGVELVDLETLFRESDFLSVSCPLNDETRHIVNAERLALMKPTAYLINTARGPVVDQKALYDALKAGRIAGAGLDVFELEPTPPGEPITQLDNVSWPRTRSAGPTSASPASVPPTSPRCSRSCRAGCRAASSIATSPKVPAGSQARCLWQNLCRLRSAGVSWEAKEMTRTSARRRRQRRGPRRQPAGHGAVRRRDRRRGGQAICRHGDHHRLGGGPPIARSR